MSEPRYDPSEEEAGQCRGACLHSAVVPEDTVDGRISQ